MYICAYVRRQEMGGVWERGGGGGGGGGAGGKESISSLSMKVIDRDPLLHHCPQAKQLPGTAYNQTRVAMDGWVIRQTCAEAWRFIEMKP